RAGAGRLAEREAADRRRARRLDARLALRAAAPARLDEPAGLAQEREHLVGAAGIAQRPPLAFVAGRAEQRRLHLPEQPLDPFADARERAPLLVAVVAARDGDRSRREIAGADLDPDGHARELGAVELRAGPLAGAVVDPDANARRPQLVRDRRGGGEHVAAIL